MPHTIERAPSGRAKCRGCGQAIASASLRFGERLPNPFADGDAEMTLWYHLKCAAYKRPEPFLETLVRTTGTGATAETGGTIGPRDDGTTEIVNRQQLEADAQAGLAHRRLPRVDAASRAPSSRAMCRACKTAIDKGRWRIALVFYEDGRFAPSGFIHLRCAREYLETTDILGRIRRFSPELSEDDVADIRADVDRP